MARAALSLRFPRHRNRGGDPSGREPPATQRSSAVPHCGRRLRRRLRYARSLLLALRDSFLGHDRGGGRAAFEPRLHVLGRRPLRLPADAALHGDQLQRVQRQDPAGCRSLPLMTAREERQMSKRVADVLIETLQAAGVKNCYGIVGDTLNQIAHAIDRSEIDWVHMRHEEAGAFAAAAEAQLTGRLTACAGTCGPGSLHFINGLYEANRNRAPVILIATQIARQDVGFDSIQEVDFVDVFKGCSVYCEMILTPEQARRKTVAACQAALTKRGVAVLVVPADVANAASHDEAPYAVHARRPLIRPSDADLDEIAAILNKSDGITIYADSGWAGAHDEAVATAARLMAPVAHTSRGKDFLEYDNPYNVGMTGIIGGGAGYHAVLDCNVLLLLGQISLGAN